MKAVKAPKTAPTPIPNVMPAQAGIHVFWASPAVDVADREVVVARLRGHEPTRMEANEH